jgi:glycosyltransferase involved in cell wall biosynthesis
MTQTFLAAVGDANDIRSWSGIPYHELQAGREQGVIDVGLPLSADSRIWTARRTLWNLAALLSGRGRGGYQYSVGFLETLWAPHRDEVRDRRVINCFQLYPPSLVADARVELWFHLDQTLLQLFDTYGVWQSIGKHIANDALERERIGYQHATGIVMHSNWAAKSVVSDYGVSAERVSVVVPGANLNREAYDFWSQSRRPMICSGASRNDPLRLLFVGKHAERKGLDRLIRSIIIARDHGANLTLRVIGCSPTDVERSLRSVHGVEWVGFIDKRTDQLKYMNAVAECHVGCLLSRAEAGGIGLREYHALGLAVLGPEVGGSPDHVIPEASRLVGPQASDDEIAEVLCELDHDREQVQKMREISWQRRSEMTWEYSVKKLSEIMRVDR